MRSLLIALIVCVGSAALAAPLTSGLGGYCYLDLTTDWSKPSTEIGKFDYVFPKTQVVKTKDGLGTEREFLVGHGKVSEVFRYDVQLANGEIAEAELKLDVEVIIDGSEKRLDFSAEVLNPFTGEVESIRRNWSAKSTQHFQYVLVNMGEKNPVEPGKPYQRVFCDFVD